MYKVVFVLVVALIQGCASNKFVQTKIYQDGISLKGKSMYVYSFMDIRDSEFGANMLKSLNKQLISGFEVEGTKVDVLDFSDSEAAMSYSMSNSGQLPVEAFISKNQDAEQFFNADYRLLIVPSQMTLQGAWKHYDVRWNLIDAKTNKIVWRAISEGSHLTGMHNDENPDGRAKTILKGLFLQLKKDKFI
jgi:hypothetical protein